MLDQTKVIAHLGPYEEFIEKEVPSLLQKLSRMTGQRLEETIKCQTCLQKGEDGKGTA